MSTQYVYLDITDTYTVGCIGYVENYQTAVKRKSQVLVGFFVCTFK